MTELLIAMAFWPWFWLAVLLTCMTVSAAYDNLGVALAFLAFYLIVVVGFFYDTLPLAWLIYHPVPFLAGLLGYGLVGIAWSLLKWRNHMRSAGMQAALKDAKRRFTEIVDGGDFKSSRFFPTGASPQNQQERILSWIALWPFSVLLYACGDMLVAAGKAMFAQLRGAYDGITERYLP